MGRILLAVVAALGVLAVVIVARGMMVGAYQPSTDAAPASQFDAAAVAAHLAEAVKFRTVSWQDGAPADDVAASQAAFVAFREWIAATYPQFAKTATREIVGEYSLLFTWTGSDTSLKPILLMSHMDVVPVVPGSEAKWTHAPFAGEIADGYVWGRGTLDVKSGIVGMLEAAEALIGKGVRPKRTIMFAFGHDEEVGGTQGNKNIAALLAQRKIELEFVDDEGGVIARGLIPGVEAPVALVGVAEKGSVTLELTAHSAGGHSSAPPAVDETAIGRLARAIERLGQKPFDSSLDDVTREAVVQMMPAMPLTGRVLGANLWLFEPLVVRAMSSTPASAALLHTTISPTIISGGVKDNVLPPEAKARINFRLHSRDTIESAIAHVRSAIDDEQVDVVLVGGVEASPVSDTRGPQFALIKRALQSVMPGVIVAPNLVVAGTDSRHYFGLTKNVFRMVPYEVGPGDISRIHGTDERVPIADMGRISDFYAALMGAM